MIDILKSRFAQGMRTFEYPNGPAPRLSDRFQGVPVLKNDKCPEDCAVCRDVCPSSAIKIEDSSPEIDLGACIFCSACSRSCPRGKIEFGADYSLSSSSREGLLIGKEKKKPDFVPDSIKNGKLFSRSLKLRQVSAGGCNACEADINVLTTLAWDIGRFGIQIVASPRHADGLIVTGPVTKNMRLALEKTYDAVAHPKIVIAVGACAISGGIYRGMEESCDGVGNVIPVDVFVPGCPPHPLTILDALLKVLGD